MIEPELTSGRLDGIGVYATALFEHLPDAGCDITPYSFPRPRVRRQGPGVIIGRRMPLSFEAATARDLLTPRFVRTRMPVDLFHAPDYRVVRMSCPVVATLHDALPVTHPEWCNPKLRSLKNWLQAKAARKARHIIAPSYAVIPDLVKSFGVDEKRISVVHQGVNEAWLAAPDRNHVAVTLKMNKLDPGYFLFVGTLQPRKNIERLLDAYVALPKEVRLHRQLVIVGSAGWRSDDIIARIKALREKRERVIWLDKLTDPAHLRHLYAGASVFVFPSLYEGFGIPVIEAFAAGLPVMTSNTTALPETSQGAAVEVDPLSVADMSSAMLSLVQDEFLRRRCIDAGRARARQLTWRHTAERTAAVYRSVLSR